MRRLIRMTLTALLLALPACAQHKPPPPATAPPAQPQPQPPPQSQSQSQSQSQTQSQSQPQSQTQPQPPPQPVEPLRPDPEPQVKAVPSAAAALVELMGGRPRVIAFGEYHQTTSTVGIRSPVKRFTEQLFPMIGALASDLVLETWITEGECGKQEKEVVKNVEKTIKRPPSTENELVTLIKTVQAAFVKPHILTLTCAEYTGLQDQGEVDYDKLLRLITAKLVEKTTDLLGKHKPGKERMVLIYGGALHNDLFPREELKAYAFGETLRGALGEKYLELDLYVPEYIDRDEQMRKEPWYAPCKKVPRGQACLVRRGPGSHILVFPRGGK